MIIFHGWGILTVAIVVILGGAVTVTSAMALDAAGLHEFSGIGLALGLFVAAAVNWYAGRRLNGDPGRELVDRATGETVVLRRSHRLFFIPMQWWSLVMVGLGLVALYHSFPTAPVAPA